MPQRMSGDEREPQPGETTNDSGDGTQRPSGHAVVPVRSALEVRREILAIIKEETKKFGLGVVEGGGKVKEVSDRIDKRTGFWANSGEYQKPNRWLFHIVPSTDGPKAVWPSQRTYRNMGILSTKRSGTLLTYRLVT